MYQYIENRLALSPQGARNLVKAILSNLLLWVALAFPVIYFFVFLKEYLPTIEGTNIHNLKGITFYILLAIFLMIVMWFFARIQYKNTYSIVYDESANRRILLAEKLRTLPLSFFAKKDISDLTSTFMSDSTDMESIFSHTVPQLFSYILSMIIICISLFIYDWRLSIALFWVIPITAFMIFISKSLNRKNNEELYEKKKAFSEKIQEGFEQIHEIKSYNKGQSFLDELNNKLNSFEKSQTKMELIAGTLLNCAQSILKLGMVSVIIVGASLYISKEIDLFTYLVFLCLSTSVYSPLIEIFSNIIALYYLDIRIKRLKEIKELPIQSGKKEFKTTNFNIEFQNVSFNYEDNKQVLKNVSFLAEQGKITALIGPSGGGKSTAIKLAARFWDIQEGKILLGNQNIQSIDPETLLKYYSVVFQDVVLFNTSIMENIRIGKKDATDEEIIQAAKLAYCDDFIRELPEGYQTIIGENGETLSGGQRQRISIARGLLKDAPIILLDEATASLDVYNESNIQAAISTLIKNKTVIIIAHRMRTIAKADKIIVLDHGSVVEKGSPDELQQRKGIFYKMVKRQMMNA